MEYYNIEDREQLIAALRSVPLGEMRSKLCTYTKAQLTKIYMLVFEAKPLSKYKKENIINAIYGFIYDTNRARVLLS